MFWRGLRSYFVLCDFTFHLSVSLQGDRGPRGPPGRAGTPGKDGENGEDGQPGANGAPGQQVGTYCTFLC